MLFSLITMTNFISSADIKTLRKNIRKIRRQLTRSQLQQAETATVFKLLQQPEIRFKQHIGIYLDAFGEVPTHALMMALFKRKKYVYLPLICNMNQELRWQKISLQQWRSQRFAAHRLGMQQAVQTRGKHVSTLDTMIMPLVVFDRTGHRVGMGGGFYDRTLAKASNTVDRIGLAHDFQCASGTLITQVWDQGLDKVITPQHIFRFER